MASFGSWMALMASTGLLFPMLAALPKNSGNETGMLLVVNKGDHTLGIVNPEAGKELATVALSGITGHEVATSPDGRFAYVPIYGDSGVGQPGTDGDAVDVIDVASHRRVATINLGKPLRPHCAVFGPNGLLYVTAELADAVYMIDPRTRKIVGEIPTKQPESHMLAITSDGKRGYTANVGPGTVSALDMNGRRTIAVIPLSKTVQRISVSVDNRFAFTADQTRPRLAVIDTATNKLKTWIALPGLAYGTHPTLDGRWLLVTIPDPSEIAVVNLQSMRVVRAIKVPSAPQEVLVRPDGKVAYISCDHSHKVAALDLANWRVAKLIDVGRNDDGLAWAPIHE